MFWNSCGRAWLAGLALLHRCDRLPNAAEYAALGLAFVLLLALRRRHWLVLAASRIWLSRRPRCVPSGG